MLVLTNGHLRSRWRMGPIALLLLLAWAPTLFYIDHWPTPALLQGGGDSPEQAFHAHGPAGDSYLGIVPVIEGDPVAAGNAVAASHAEHGHGSNSAQGAASTALVVPEGLQVAPLLMSLAVSAVVSGPIAGEMRAPPSPPPR
jgi:hypothetical protein